MKKIFVYTFFIIFLLISIIVAYLNIFGYETDKFNELISKKVSIVDNKINIKFNKIKLKLDIRKLSFYLTTRKPKFAYEKIEVEIEEISVYSNITSVIKGNFNINKMSVGFSNLEVKKIQKIFLNRKPSNLKSIILNNLKKGALNGNIEIFFDNNFKIVDYNLNGFAKKFVGNLSDRIKIDKTDFIFSIKKDSGIIKDLTGKIKDFDITNGQIQYLIKKDTEINAKANTKIYLNQNKIKNLFQDFKETKLFNNKIKLNLNATHQLKVIFDETLKMKNYSYNSEGEISNSNIILNNPIETQFLKDEIKSFNFDDSKFSLDLNSDDRNSLLLVGNYKLNEDNFNKYRIENNFSESENRFKTSFEFSELITIPFLNYSKDNLKKAQINSNIVLKKNTFNINNFEFKENKNSILINDLKIGKNNAINSLGFIKVKMKKNNFTISLDKKLKIFGTKYDATNLSKILNKNNENNFFKKINKEVNINLDNIKTSFSKDLSNFNLIGKMQNGKFIKINSKGEFEENKYLDISIRKDPDTDKKILEVYSDFPEPLLSDYSFFKGLSGGKLLYNSSYDEKISVSNLTIENFKVVNAPGFVKLLSLADFSGMADVLSGEGLSFEKLEMNFVKNNEQLTLDELYAIGPSISILLEGYVESKTGLVSLRGTMVPAKNLNNLLSKIPVVGKILIPKEIGEGLFGVSFKMKGLPGKIKMTVNPIKTLTPRFIQKALEKKTK